MGGLAPFRAGRVPLRGEASACVGRSRRARHERVAARARRSARGERLAVSPPRRTLTGGARVGDALPLDELSRHSAAALPSFLVVWSVAAHPARAARAWARTERLTAALLLAGAVGGWTTRRRERLAARRPPDSGSGRVPRSHGAAGGLAPRAARGRRRRAARAPPLSARPRAPLVLALVVAAAGIVGVLAAILPVHDRPPIERFAPERCTRSPMRSSRRSALALVVVARGLARRKRRAWHAALALLAPLALLHLLHGFGTPARRDGARRARATRAPARLRCAGGSRRRGRGCCSGRRLARCDLRLRLRDVVDEPAHGRPAAHDRLRAARDDARRSSG